MEKVCATIQFEEKGAIIEDHVPAFKVAEDIVVSFSEDSGICIDQVNEANVVTEFLGNINVDGADLADFNLERLSEMSALDLIIELAAIAKGGAH
ncbi:hypothetical protein CEF21_15065 [Bacillus sp. FJAT-42376]|uniref:hypothetical protein n=1 Tax=Bacillus sp. FJAT-42376 TaxID=2014076 RepID=UPI000F4EE1DD|nr:hypothetical protein [Bacillus sp. FJAT-42376]AZB43516.1 hypothetical protein CEF21_15065 [Bacillus sp. FJAT-42376]